MSGPRPPSGRLPDRLETGDPSAVWQSARAGPPSSGSAGPRALTGSCQPHSRVGLLGCDQLLEQRARRGHRAPSPPRPDRATPGTRGAIRRAGSSPLRAVLRRVLQARGSGAVRGSAIVPPTYVRVGAPPTRVLLPDRIDRASR